MATLLILTTSGQLVAQSVELPETPTTIIDINLDTGICSAKVAANADEARVLFSHDLIIPGAPWVRLHFTNVTLSAAEDGSHQSFLRITSMKDGAQQTLTAMDMIYWGKSSAYFNGDEVLVELLAYPGTGENRLVIDKVLTTELSHDPTCTPGTLGICGSTDDRVVSSEPGVGRMRFTSDFRPEEGCFKERRCTAFLINDEHCGFLSAGHCCKKINSKCLFSSIVEFNVPLSDLDGTINASAPWDQYPIDVKSSVQWSDIAPNDGRDYCYFGVYPNQVGIDETPKDAGVGSQTLASTVPVADQSELRVSGYGMDSDPYGDPAGDGCNEYQHTLQSDTGPYTNLNGDMVEFEVDARPGNSGSPVIHETSGEVYAILTDAGCPGADNFGSRVDQAGLLAFLADPQGLCGDCNFNGIQDCKDLASFTEFDCNFNGILDVCEEKFLTACCTLTGCINDLTNSQCNAVSGSWYKKKACCPLFCESH